MSLQIYIARPAFSRHSRMDMPKRDLNVRFAFAKSENPQAAISSPIGALERTSLRLSSAYRVRRIASWGENLRDRPHERPIL